MRTTRKVWLDRDVGKRSGGHRWDAGGESAPHVRYARSLVQAREALLGSHEQYEGFKADPGQYLKRFGIDIRSLASVNRKEIEALIGLQEKASPQQPMLDARSADPAGNSEARVHLAQARSPIHGDGIFTNEPLAKGSVVCTVLQEDKVTDTASKINRSTEPNTEMEQVDGKLVVEAVEPIEAGKELLADYPLPH